MDITTTPVATAKPKHFGVLAFLAIAVGVLLAFYRAWIWCNGLFTAEAAGYAMGGLLLPALIAYAIAGRKKARNPNLFALSFCALCVFSLLLEISNRPLGLKERMAGLMKEAAGTKARDAAESPIDALARKMFEDILQQRKSYEVEVAKFKDDMAHIYTAESYSSKPSMQRSIKSMQAVLALDQQYTRQLQVLPQHMKELADRSSLSEEDKQGFMKGVNETMANSKLLSVRDQAIEAEARWVDATVTLYNLASANVAKIHVKNSKILIDDEKLRTEFNKDLEKSQDLRKSIDTLNAQVNQLQQEALQQSGLTKQDLKIDGSEPQPH